MDARELRIREQLEYLYEPEAAERAFAGIRGLMEDFAGKQRLPRGGRDRFTEKDAVLITYGDQVRSADNTPLRTGSEFLKNTVGDEVSIVHLLPFFPYSSDDGFAVKDYRSVNPDYGNWADVQELGKNFDLMFDAVINHVSRQSKWFRRYRKGDPGYENFFLEVDEDWDLSRVVRPRDNPLTVEVEVEGEEKKLWSTFSSDQLDLNYGNPEVLLRIVDLLLFYVGQGAKIIRLDAIAYLWKKPGTTCIHLEETHKVIRLFRAVLDSVAPDVALITETNVPHEQNVSYFGDGTNEAQLVYQFPLPPLVLDAFITGDAGRLRDWVGDLEYPASEATFFNFLASHDGIGLRPVEGILTDRAIDRMVERTRQHGGYVSYRADPEGGSSPYELNISYFDALSDPESEERRELQVRRFLCSQAIMLALRGVPGIYFHSLFGSRNWKQGVEKTGRKRSINRKKLELSRLRRELNDRNSVRSRVLRGYKELLSGRKSSSAFHPGAEQVVVDAGSEIFAILRRPSGSEKPVLCLHNITGESQSLSPASLEGVEITGPELEDLITGRSFAMDKSGEIGLSPCEFLWLREVG